MHAYWANMGEGKHSAQDKGGRNLPQWGRGVGGVGPLCHWPKYCPAGQYLILSGGGDLSGGCQFERSEGQGERGSSGGLLVGYWSLIPYPLKGRGVPLAVWVHEEGKEIRGSG